MKDIGGSLDITKKLILVQLGLSSYVRSLHALLQALNIASD